MFISGVNHPGDKLFSDVNDITDKFIPGVNDTSN
jgi:hypothetical protein